MISRGGALISVTTDQRRSGFKNRLLRGVAPPAAVAELKARLTQNQVGLQASCAVDPTPAIGGSYEITWYGRSGRRNTFTARYGAAAAGFPACPPEVQRIIDAIFSFEFAVFIDPDSERLASD